MNLLKILTKVGGAILADVVPGGNTILKAVNEFLPADKKLPEKSTGLDIQAAISDLPKNQQFELLNKSYDVELAEIKSHVEVIKALGDVDKTGNSTRPEIALMMAKTVCFSVICTVAGLFIAIVLNRPDIIKALSDNWLLIASVLGTPTALLIHYFGIRSKEKHHKYQAVSQQAFNSPVSNLLSMLPWSKKS